MCCAGKREGLLRRALMHHRHQMPPPEAIRKADAAAPEADGAATISGKPAASDKIRAAEGTSQAPAPNGCRLPDNFGSANSQAAEQGTDAEHSQQEVWQALTHV